MLGWLKGRALRRRTGQQLYEKIVAQSRMPALYQHYSVPDTMDGRLEMVLLHTVLVLDRLHAEAMAGQRLGQQVMEHLVADIDDALRQIGLGDDSVSPRIKRLGGALAERVTDYREALGSRTPASGAPPPLAAKLLEHAYRIDPAAATPRLHSGAEALAAYARRARATLHALPSVRVLDADISFPSVVDLDAGALETRA
jgi:cytochrome b pre-mRNA-processing protein 3